MDGWKRDDVFSAGRVCGMEVSSVCVKMEVGYGGGGVTGVILGLRKEVCCEMFS